MMSLRAELIRPGKLRSAESAFLEKIDLFNRIKKGEEMLMVA